MLAHNVFFTLADKSKANREKLIAACKKYLVEHAGSIFFACGELAEGLHRDVNDRDFDVGLHIVFKDQASHDRYQEAPRHQQFVAECKPLWSRVRVFDSVVDR
jgi:quinol monooxygenase YgiN